MKFSSEFSNKAPPKPQPFPASRTPPPRTRPTRRSRAPPPRVPPPLEHHCSPIASLMRLVDAPSTPIQRCDPPPRSPLPNRVPCLALLPPPRHGRAPASSAKPIPRATRRNEALAHQSACPAKPLLARSQSCSANGLRIRSPKFSAMLPMACREASPTLGHPVLLPPLPSGPIRQHQNPRLTPPLHPGPIKGANALPKTLPAPLPSAHSSAPPAVVLAHHGDPLPARHRRLPPSPFASPQPRGAHRAAGCPPEAPPSPECSGSSPPLPLLIPKPFLSDEPLPSPPSAQNPLTVSTRTHLAPCFLRLRGRSPKLRASRRRPP